MIRKNKFLKFVSKLFITEASILEQQNMHICIEDYYKFKNSLFFDLFSISLSITEPKDINIIFQYNIFAEPNVSVSMIIVKNNSENLNICEIIFRTFEEKSRIRKNKFCEFL